MNLCNLFWFVLIECAHSSVCIANFFVCLFCLFVLRVYDLFTVFHELEPTLNELLIVCFLCPLEGRNDKSVGGETC